MELQTTIRRVGMTKTVFDDFDERPVDCDFMLPDFLPDIASILKCTMKPTVYSHQISGDRVMVDGTVHLHVLYLDEDRRCVRSFENQQPFTSMFTVKELPGNNTVRLSAKANYVNCRATSPRRVDIHGAFSVKLIVSGLSETEVVESAGAPDLYTKGCRVACSVPAGNAEKTFTLNEVLELDTAVPAEVIVRSEARIGVSECKQLMGKAVIKGDILLKTVYTTDSIMGTLCQAKHSIPFSQILDVDGLTEEMKCQARAEIISCDVRLAQNPNGENRLLSVSIKSALWMQCFADETYEVLTDAFHTTYPLAVTTQRITPLCITDLSQELLTVQQSVALPDGDIVELSDVWSEITGAVCNEGVLEGQFLVQLLARDTNGAISYYERQMDFQMPMEGVCAQTAVDVSVLSTDYTIVGDRIELCIKLLVCRCTSQGVSFLAITGLQADESAPYACSEGMENCQVKVCFANAGDSVWEIAKAEHASPTALMRENDLTDEILPKRTMLLIPLC